MIRKILLLIFLIHQVIYAHVFHYIPQKEELLTNEFVWTQEYCDPFDEILLAWNAERPSTGAYIIEISLFTDTWSPWFPYAYWSKDNQHVHNLEFFKQAGVFLHTQKATGFKIRVSAQEKTSFDKFYALHASLTLLKDHTVLPPTPCDNRIEVRVPAISQQQQKHDSKDRICSPVATVAVVQKFLKKRVDPLHFATSVRETMADIYGVWALNTAEAANTLGKQWFSYPSRLSGFDDIIYYLKRGYPVVVSIQGPLPGGSTTYAQGHLMVVRGYDPHRKLVLCMDPAFPTHEQTLCAYQIDDFMVAWGKRRSGLSYIITQPHYELYHTPFFKRLESKTVGGQFVKSAGSFMV